jgi:cytochrome P450
MRNCSTIRSSSGTIAFPTSNLAFGFGAHQCLGMSPARLELATFLRLLLPRLEAIELDGVPSWTQTNFVQGMKRMPIRYKMTPAAVR